VDQAIMKLFGRELAGDQLLDPLTQEWRFGFIVRSIWPA